MQLNEIPFQIGRHRRGNKPRYQRSLKTQALPRLRMVFALSEGISPDEAC